MLEIKDIASQLGLKEEDFESKETFNKAFKDPERGYVSRATAAEDEQIAETFKSTVYGPRFGQMEALIRSTAKELGITELASGKVEDLLIDATKKIKGHVQKITEDSQKGQDEKVTELSKQLEQYKKDWESEKERADKTNELWETSKAEFEGYKTNLKKTTLFEQALKSVELVPDITDIQRKGFNALIGETYSFELSKDGDSLEVYKDGKKAKTEAGNQFMTAEEAIRHIAEENKLLKKNNLNAGNRFISPQPTPNGETERVSRSQKMLEKNPKFLGA